MQSTLPMHLSPRCGGYSRRTGRSWRNAAMANGRCRILLPFAMACKLVAATERAGNAPRG
jgi:hypothetical protein